MKASTAHIFDELLVLQSQRGDMEAFSLLVKRWQPALLKQAYRMTQNTDAALDITQDSWQAIVKGIYRLKDARVFKTWAFRIVTNKSANWVKLQQRERKWRADPELMVLAKEPESQGEDNLQKIKVALHALPAKSKLLLSMFYIDNLTVKDISAVMKVSEGTVKSRLFYARQKLKESFEKLK